jgi:hypothetical protein
MSAEVTYYTPEPATQPWWNASPRCIHCNETGGMHLVTDDERLRCVPPEPPSPTSSEQHK